MSQSLAQVLIHIVFSTKERHPFIDTAIESQLYAYIGDTIKRSKGVPVKINGTTDHVHILTSMPRTTSLADFIEDIKRNSSRWIKTKGSEYEKFAWQNGYGAFSVSFSQKGAVLEYILSQKEHHFKLTFKEELIVFLRKHEIAYDERYLWD
ncbi:MAG: IS200/IS605 family transposase [Planctomycetaceae bacterium]|nr:IS200/IS605 family transposase [Planctomycetaceae bacterium]